MSSSSFSTFCCTFCSTNQVSRSELVCSRVSRSSAPTADRFSNDGDDDEDDDDDDDDDGPGGVEEDSHFPGIGNRVSKENQRCPEVGEKQLLNEQKKFRRKKNLSQHKYY